MPKSALKTKCELAVWRNTVTGELHAFPLGSDQDSGEIPPLLGSAWTYVGPLPKGIVVGERLEVGPNTISIEVAGAKVITADWVARQPQEIRSFNIPGL